MKQVIDPYKSFLVELLHICWKNSFKTMLRFNMLQSIRSILFCDINFVTIGLQ